MRVSSPADAGGRFRPRDRAGIRLSADERTAQAELETLLRHHAFSRSGLSLLPQGTPTNNTDTVSSAAGRSDAADESFDDRRRPLFIPTSKWFDKKDGQWLAKALGIDPSLFAHVHHADATDQSSARAMNMALWPATFGYWMESMMAPMFPAGAVDLTRRFFTRYVVGSGRFRPSASDRSLRHPACNAVLANAWFNQPQEEPRPIRSRCTLSGCIGSAEAEPEWRCCWQCLIW